jgi:hypothetical protein
VTRLKRDDNCRAAAERNYRGAKKRETERERERWRRRRKKKEKNPGGA